MAYLLDSHAIIWHRSGSERLSLTASHLMESESVELFISEATFWEITIKHSLGKLELLGGLESLRLEWIENKVAQSLTIDWKHILATSSLPPLHRDPFDRMLIAQAMEENLTIVTCDENIKKYPGVKTVW